MAKNYMDYLMGQSPKTLQRWQHENIKQENKKKRRKKGPEQAIQDEIIHYLVENNFLVMRLNSSVLWSEQTGRPIKSYTIANLGSSSGASDVLAFKSFLGVMIEIKTAKGRLTDSQKKFKELCESLGVDYYVVRSLEEAKAVIKKYTWLRIIKRALREYKNLKPEIFKNKLNQIVEQIDGGEG